MPGWSVLAAVLAACSGETVVAPSQEYEPVADPAAVVVAGNARFTILTPRLIRLEWSPAARFEDRASFTVVNRRLPVPAFEQGGRRGRIEIRTAALTLRYIEGAGAFDRDNLAIEFTVEGEPTVWTPGATNNGDLRGTRRTLDGVSGACPLDPGLLSRSGWTLLDDSARPLFGGADQCGWPHVEPRSQADAIDWYFFAYDQDYVQALQDFTAISGRIPLPPRYVFGAWWSRYWPYSDQELMKLVQEFREHHVPLDVLVLDMDWHLDGWTGYTWNPKYFPFPEKFLAWAESEGLKVPLNIHPHEGVGKQEAAFEQFCDALGLDPQTTERIPFDPTDARFMQNYFELLHHPLERQGVDFWWLDWQQGETTRIPGLDPLFWLNHLYWTDWEKNPGSKPDRPLIFSRWGGLGNQRYPIGFSGDTFNDWASLAWQPYFTATAGNVGCAYWSHDIGGHQPGPVAPELYARWIQFGALSPVLRTHCGRNPLAERRIWTFEPEVYAACKEAWQLRYALLPYIYTAARKTYDESIPLCRPMYYEWPDLDAAYGAKPRRARRSGDHDAPATDPAYKPADRIAPHSVPGYNGQYMFGDDLLVAPAVEPMNPASGTASVRVWLPPGRWRNWFTGRAYEGPCDAYCAVPLKQVPLFVRDGAAIPMAPAMRSSGEKPLDPLILHLFPAPTAARYMTRLYEDDGISGAYKRGECAWTPILCESSAHACRIEIGPTEGRYAGMPAQRGYEVWLRDVLPPQQVLVDGTPLLPAQSGAAEGWRYDGASLSAIINLPARPRAMRVVIDVVADADDESVRMLSAGLRDEIDALRELAARTGDAAPGGIRLVAQLPDELEAVVAAASAPSTRPGDRVAGQNIVPEILVSKVAPEKRLHALARLFSLYNRIEVRPNDEDPRLLDARADVGCGRQPVWTTRVVPRAELRVLDAGARGGPSESDPLTDDGLVLRALATIELPAVLQTFRVRSTLTLDVDGSEFSLPVEQVVLPSVNAWWLAGPFDRKDAGRIGQEILALARVDPAQHWPAADGQAARWRRVVRKLTHDSDVTSEFVVDPIREFGAEIAAGVAYAVTWLHAPRDMNVNFAIGSDDGVIVWVNGREYHRNLVQRPYSARQDIVAVPLRTGANMVVLQTQQLRGRWAFSLCVETPGGEPIPEIEVRLEP